MIRVTLAVLVTMALLGAAIPVVDTARVAHGEAAVEGAVNRLADAARTLAERNDAPGPETRGAQRVLSLDLPRESWGTAGLERLAITPGPTGRTIAVRWRVERGGRTVRHLAPVPLELVGDRIETRTGGELRLRLTLGTHGGNRTVRVRQLQDAAGGRS